MAAFTGCYLGVDGTYRARMAPVNHNATNDFTVIAEITWNYSGSDIPRLKEREHLPEARLDFRSFSYVTNGHDDARFVLQTLEIDREAEESLDISILILLLIIGLDPYSMTVGKTCCF